MSRHEQQHSLTDANSHKAGAAPSAGAVNVVGTDNAGAVVEVFTEPPGGTPVGGAIMRRATDGQIVVKTSGQASDEAVSLGQIEALISAGIWKANVHSFAPVHNVASVGDSNLIPPQTSDVLLGPGARVVNTGDNKIYTVVSGSGTGNNVTWDTGVLPTTAEIRIDTSSDTVWIYDTEGAIWINRGATDHTEQHTVDSHSDTTATGAELETLTDSSNADALHSHLQSVPVTSRSTNVTLTVGEKGAVLCSGTIEIILPASSGNAGLYFLIRNVGSGVVTLSTTGGDTISGEASEELIEQEAFYLIADGSAEWGVH